jgi:two-component system response regulator AtoC
MKTDGVAMNWGAESNRDTLHDAPIPPGLSEPGSTRDEVVLCTIDVRGSTSRLLSGPGCLVVGRGPDVDVTVACEMASRRHAILHIGSHVEVEDLGSRNGTVLAGARLKPGTRHLVRPGEVVLIGSGLLVLRKMLLGTVVPTLVTPENLLASLLSPRAPGDVIAIIRFRFRQSIHGDWLATLLANIFGATARLADWGDRSWRLACALADAEGAATCRRFALCQLISCGVQVVSDVACFPFSTHENEIRRHPILTTGSSERDSGPQIISRSKQMVGLLALADKVAGSDLPVLILGETGVGKELVASFVHRRSPRSGHPILRLNCATLSESLLESELFGHEAGAFTGAKQRKAGLLEIADGGTVFLDEVAELPLTVQAKILRAVELHQFMRVGGTQVIPTNVRFVSATNRELVGATNNGKFREDLYFRLAGIVLRVPALRDRPDDIPPLAHTFLDRGDTGRACRFSTEAMAELCCYGWPGNVRELHSVVARARLLCDDEEITPQHLIFDRHAAAQPASLKRLDWDNEDKHVPFPFRDPVAARCAISEALEQTDGNQTQAARMLGISRRALVNRLEDLGFPRPRIRSGHS